MKSAAAAPSLPAVPSSSPPKAGASHLAERTGLNSLLSATSSIEQPALPSATPAPLSEASQRELAPQPETPGLISDQPQTSLNEPLRSPRNATDRTLSILKAMESAHLDHLKRVPCKPMPALVSKPNDKNHISLDWSTPTYGPDANVWCTLSALLKKPVESITAKTGIRQIDQKPNLKQLQDLFAAAGYNGNMIEFCSADKVKKYLKRAVEKAPELILKLMLGCVQTNGEGKIFVVKAWLSRLEDKKLIANATESEISAAPAEAKDDAEENRNKNTVCYRLIEYTSDDSQVAWGSFKKLPPCKSFWLYETGKRFQRTTPESTEKVSKDSRSDLGKSGQ